MANSERLRPDKKEVYRLPLVGSYNQRSVGAALTTASGIVGIGVVGVMIVGSTSSANRDQRFVNVILDKISNSYTNKETFVTYKRPGFEANTTPAAGAIGTAIRVWTGQGSGDKIVTAFGDTNSTIYDGVTSLGALTGVASDITETLVGTTPTIVIPVTNGKGYWYQDAGALTEITDADYPGNAGLTPTGTFVHKDGYTFIMTTTSRIYNSDPNSIANWSSTSHLSANMYPDRGVGLARYKDLIVAFGRESMEFFRNVGNVSGSPMQLVSEAFIKIGCVGPEAIVQLEDNVAWVGSSDIGSNSIYILDGYKPIRISTSVIDTQLQLRGSSTIYLSSAKLFGKTFIFVQSSAVTYVYCVEDGMWVEWSGQARYWHKLAANTAASSVVYSVTRDLTTGKVYKLNPVSPVYLDDSNTYTMTIQTSKFDLNKERRKFLHKLALIGDRPESTATINISWSDDDYVSFTTPRTVDMNSARAYLTNLGQFRRRSFRITNDSQDPIRFEGIELEVSEGMH